MPIEDVIVHQYRDFFSSTVPCIHWLGLSYCRYNRELPGDIPISAQLKSMFHYLNVNLKYTNPIRIFMRLLTVIVATIPDRTGVHLQCMCSVGCM